MYASLPFTSVPMSSIVRSRLVRTKLTPTTVLRPDLVFEPEVVGILRHRLHVRDRRRRRRSSGCGCPCRSRAGCPTDSCPSDSLGSASRYPGSSSDAKALSSRHRHRTCRAPARTLSSRSSGRTNPRSSPGRRRTGCRRSRGAEPASRPSRSGWPTSWMSGTERRDVFTLRCEAEVQRQSRRDRPVVLHEEAQDVARRSCRWCRCRRSCSSRKCPVPEPTPGTSLVNVRVPEDA